MEILILIWLMCAVLAHGLMFAYFQREYDMFGDMYYWSDMAWISCISMLGGPAALLGMLLFLCTAGNFKHGFKFY